MADESQSASNAVSRGEVDHMIRAAIGETNAKIDLLLARQGVPDPPSPAMPQQGAPRQQGNVSSAAPGESNTTTPLIVPQWWAQGAQPDLNFPTLPHLSSAQPPFSVLPNQQILFTPTMLNQAPAPLVPGITITKVLPPIPGFVVERIHAGIPIEMDLLLPTNIKLMPGSAQEWEREKSKKDSGYVKVSSIQDWIEAFTVYMAVLGRREGSTMEIMLDLIGYMALVTNMAKTCPFQQIMDYDKAFRRAAGTGTSWSELDLNIWLACSTRVPKSAPSAQAPAPPIAPVPKSAAASSKASSSKGEEYISKQLCYPFNTKGCQEKNCKRRHECLFCRENHPKSECPALSGHRSPSPSKGKRKRSPSPSDYSRSRSAPASPSRRRVRRRSGH